MDPLGWGCSQEIGHHPSSERVSAPALAPILISCPPRLLPHLSLGANGRPCPGLAPTMRPPAQEAKPLPGGHGGSEPPHSARNGSRSPSTPSASPPRAWPSLHVPVSITPPEACDRCNQLYSQTKQLQLNSETSRQAPVVSHAAPPPSCLLPTCSPAPCTWAAPSPVCPEPSHCTCSGSQ